jgi:hypothetical protein
MMLCVSVSNCPWTHGGSGRVVDCRRCEIVLEPFDRGRMGASICWESAYRGRKNA